MLFVYIFVLGTAIGSFLNVLIDRFSNNTSILGRSKCDYCGKKLAPSLLLPVVSYLFLKGKSRCCGKKLSLYYPAIEIITGVAFVFATYYIGIESIEDVVLLNYISIARVIATYGMVSFLIIVFFADLKYHIIPDEAVASIILLSIPSVLARQILIPNVGAGAILFLIMFAIFAVTRGKGMGLGDVKLAFAIGFFLGLNPGLVALYIAFVIGGIVSTFALLLKKRGLKSKIAFGPFMVIGMFIMLFYRFEVLDLIAVYLKLSL